MKTIPVEKIDEVWKRISEASEPDTRAMAQRMRREQPFIMVYLLAMDEDLFDESERGRLMELGAIICQIMSSAGQKLPKVNDQDIEAAEEANVRMLQEMDQGR